MRIALFGTSADPPTAGHQTIIKWLSEHYDWVAVWAADNPFKSHQTPLSHRVAMLRLLIADVMPQQNIGLEQELSATRTLLSVEKAKRRWLDATFTLTIGSDLLTQLSNWYQVENLLQEVQLLVVPRSGYAINELSLEKVRQLGGKIAIANFTGPEVSSTAYRENGDKEALTLPVFDYIHQQHLYESLSENSTF
ncbi:MAG: nicotinate-nucleotide adenylyltransferase [Rhizonema sp. NSF051]|nr:nicotinate-nucleotide adenylyltransferase [Rhizonema sp. NSF051]